MCIIRVIVVRIGVSVIVIAINIVRKNPILARITSRDLTSAIGVTVTIIDTIITIMEPIPSIVHILPLPGVVIVPPFLGAGKIISFLDKEPGLSLSTHDLRSLQLSHLNFTRMSLPDPSLVIYCLLVPAPEGSKVELILCAI